MGAAASSPSKEPPFTIAMFIHLVAIVLGLSAIYAGYTVLYRSIFDSLEEVAEAHATTGHRRREVIQRLSLPQLRIPGEFGTKNQPPRPQKNCWRCSIGAIIAVLFIIATNRPLEEWDNILGDHASTSVFLGRF